MCFQQRETRETLQVLTIFVHGMWVRLFLANLSKGADNGNEVVPPPLILMVVFLEKGFPHFNPHTVIQVTEQFLLVQYQV